MVTHLDVKIGELYSLKLPDDEEIVIAEFVKEMRDGRLMFKREGTDREIYVEIDVFEHMRSNGDANRIRLDADRRIISKQEIDPRTLLDPDDPNITMKERRARLLQQDRLDRSRTLRFYAMRYDEAPHVGRGRLALEKFIKDNLPDAIDQGLSWKPSPSSVLRAVDESGTPGSRHLTDFFKQRSNLDRERRWPKDVVSAANRAIEAYWDDQSCSIGDALALFEAEAADIDNVHFLPVAQVDAEDAETETFERDENGRLQRKKRQRKSSYPIPAWRPFGSGSIRMPTGGTGLSAMALTTPIADSVDEARPSRRRARSNTSCSTIPSLTFGRWCRTRMVRPFLSPGLGSPWPSMFIPE